MSWYLAGTVFALLAAGMNQFIICQGFAKVGMKSVVLGAVCNIALDPVFIFVLDMGVKGAAIATVLSQMASCIYVLVFLFGKMPLVRITFGGYRWNTMKQVLLVGLSPFLIIASDSLLLSLSFSAVPISLRQAKRLSSLPSSLWSHSTCPSAASMRFPSTWSYILYSMVSPSKSTFCFT